jgi:hypothetical protein
MPETADDSPRTDAPVLTRTRAGKRTVQNCTPKRLSIHGDGGVVLSLAPLERVREVEDEVLARFALQPLELRGLVRVRDVVAENRFETVLGLLPTLAFVFLVFGFTLSETIPRFWTFALPTFAVIVLIALFVAARGARSAGQSAVQFMSLMLASITAVAIPASIIYLFGGGSAAFEGDRSLLTLGRGLQFLLITTAALLPALLYYLFDRQQLATLRDRFEQQIFRFDPDVRTLADVRARYGRQMEEVYGRDEGIGQSRLNRAKQWPILVATLVLTFGWILALSPVHDGTAPPVLTEPADLLRLFLPQPEPMVWGFLGAYFFALHTVLHRYVRRDLKPSAYATITVRVLSVLILSWVLSPLPWEAAVSALVFVIGIFPESGVALLQHATRSALGVAAPEAYKEEHPLTKLEGIGLYDRARLEDEGVTNVQSLAHHDLIDLMVETRIPVPRLVDWVDQAILYLHIDRPTLVPHGATDWRTPFASAGIRTATDLLRVYEAALRDEEPIIGLQALTGDAGPEPDPLRLHRLHALVAAIKDDEWLRNLRCWREAPDVQDLEVLAPATDPLPAPGPQTDASEPDGIRVFGTVGRMVST